MLIYNQNLNFIKFKNLYILRCQIHYFKLNTLRNIAVHRFLK